MRRGPLALLSGAALLLAACTTSANASDPTWVPSPDFGTNGEGPGVELTPIIPKPSASTRPTEPGPSGQSVAPDPSAGKASDPAVVATKLSAPVGLTLLPDGTALVGERTTGRIVRVQPKAGQPVPTVRTLTGLDTSGDGGLLDLALSPTYDEDNLIYAYITTRTDNRVVDFTLNGPVTPVLTGIPKGKTDNTGRLLFGADGRLYVGTGDAGHPSLANNPKSLAGKVLRVTDIGAAAPGNPTRTPVWTSGHRVVDGLCAMPRTTSILEVETGQLDEVNALRAGGSYGSPTAAGNVREPIATMPTDYGAPGGCAVLNGAIWITSLDGQALLSARLLGSGDSLALTKFGTPSLHNRYGRLKTVVAATDGALWLTTSNRDGHGTPVPDDERVIRYVPTGGGSGGNPA
jgi:glucose/arabinose dehydrogenase